MIFQKSQLKPVHRRQCKRLEDRLLKICIEVSTKYKREGGGRQKRKLNDKMKKLAVYETETVSNIYATVSKFEKDKIDLTEKCRLLLSEINEANKKIAGTEKVLSNNVTELSEITEGKELLLDCLGNYNLK